MANPEHIEILKQGVEAWNKWREEDPEIRPDLSGADVHEASLWNADLRGANLAGADLDGADLSGANLREANLLEASLWSADLGEADLRGAHLRRADLFEADLWNADLREANLTQAALVETSLEQADLSGCRIYGISAWDLRLEGASQTNLIITPEHQSTITVDNLEVAQFIYLLLNNERLRHVIDTITSKVVLILGRFTPERKVVLDRIRDTLRERDYLPVLFDFDKPTNRSTMETVSTLAHMARFVIADLTDAKCVLQELRGIVPDLPSVPVQPLLHVSDYEPGMVDFFKRFPWFLEVHRYEDLESLLASLESSVIAPAVEKARELTAG